MGKIKKILENELVGGTQTTDVYPVTSIKAVYDESNERLDNIINRKGVVNISTNYNSDHIAEVLTLSKALSKVPSTNRVLGFQGKYLASDGWHTIVYTGDSLTSWNDRTKWIDLADKVLISISNNATFAGIATPTTNPGTPDGLVFYLATTAGVYTNFGGIEVAKGEAVILQWNNSAWDKKTSGLVTQNKLTELEQEIIYDISARNGGVVFESLSALLSASNLSTLIPTSVRRGGMTIRFIQSPNNRYVEYRLMSNNFSTKEANWQGVEDEPILNSKNIPTSDAVAKSLLDIDYELGKEKTYIYGKGSYCDMMLVETEGYPKVPSNIAAYNGIIIPIVEGKKYKLEHPGYSIATFSSYPIVNDSSNVLRINFLTGDSQFTAEKNEKYLLVSIRLSDTTTVSISVKESGLFERVSSLESYASSSANKVEQVQGLVEQTQGLVEQTQADNSKTTNKALLRKSINLFDGEFVNKACNSTTGILTNSTIYKATKNSIPVSNGQTLYFTYTNSAGNRDRIGGYLQEYSDIEGTIPILRDTRLSSFVYKCTDNNVKSIRTSFRADILGIDVDTMEYMIYVDNVYANIYKQQASSNYPQYVPMGYLNELDPSKNTLLGSLTGKKVICFGDSNTERGFYPQYAGLICGADIKNCGVGGTWLTHRVGNGYDLNTAYGKFSGDALADSIASGDFSAQVEAADYIYANANHDVRKVASELVSTDWNNVNIVTFAFGANDYKNTDHVEGTADSMDPLTYRGAVNYIVNKIQTVYPHIKIIFICTTYRVYPYGKGHDMTNEEYQNSSYLTPGFEDSDTWENLAGYTLKYIIKTVEDQAAINHCGCLNMYYNFGINKYTYLKYLVDGTHLTYDGYREYGLRLAKFLMSNA